MSALTQLMGRWAERVLFTVVGLAVLVYAGDWVVFTLRGAPMSQVTVDRSLAIPLKGNKTEYDYQGSDPVACAQALFSRKDASPCWYLERHRSQVQKF